MDGNDFAIQIWGDGGYDFTTLRPVIFMMRQSVGSEIRGQTWTGFTAEKPSDPESLRAVPPADVAVLALRHRSWMTWKPDTRRHPQRSILRKTVGHGHLGGSINGGTPKWMLYKGKSHLNGCFRGPLSWKPSFAHEGR